MTAVRSAAEGSIYLAAPSGNPNYGDEFIIRAWLRYLARVAPAAEVVVDCHTPGQASVLLTRWHPNVRFVDTVWRICFETAELPAAEAAAVAADVLANPGRLPRIASGVDLLAHADTVHLVGGGYVNVVWSHHVALLATAAAAARQFDARAVATGQGLLPIGDDDWSALLTELIDDFAIFDVRDEPSYRVIGTADPRHRFTGDDAWLDAEEPANYNADSRAADRDLVFCLQSDLMEDFADGEGVDGLARIVDDVVDRWQVSDDQIAFLECIPGADRRVFDKVAGRLPAAVFVPFTELWNGGLPARPGQTWVSTRFHPHLLAAAAGANGIALSGRSDYYPVKHRSLTDAGSRWQIADSVHVPDSPPRAGGFPAEDAAALVAGKTALANELYPPPSTWRRAARALRTRAGR